MRYSVILFFTLPLFLFSQNQVPVVSNVSATADTANRRIDVNFDLSDNESDPLEVWLQASADSGKTWIVTVDSVSGDTGFPVTTGTGKMISWNYNPAVLATYGNGLTGFRLRVVADDRQTIDLQDIVDDVDSLRVLSDLNSLEVVRHRTTGLVELELAKDSLEKRLSEAGLQPYRQGAMFSGYMNENIIGLKSGTRQPKDSWMISGHFDTVNNAPGSDDNASAVVTVLEAIRILSNYQTKNSVRYFFFDLEEAGLIGSKQYLQSGVPSWENMQGLLNMDAIGYYDDSPNSQSLPSGFNILFPNATAQIQADSNRGNFINSIVNTPSAHLDSIFLTIVSTYQPGLKVISLETPGTGTMTPDLRRSDHAGFWDIGVPAIFFTDGANFRNPNYHTPGDTVGTLTMHFLLSNIRSIVAMLAEVARLEHSGVGESNDVQLALPNSRIEKQLVEVPLLNVYPNPGDGSATLNFNLEKPGIGKISLTDHHGSVVKDFGEKRFVKGDNQFGINTDLAAGHYTIILEIDDKQSFASMVIVK